MKYYKHKNKNCDKVAIVYWDENKYRVFSKHDGYNGKEYYALNTDARTVLNINYKEITKKEAFVLIL